MNIVCDTNVLISGVLFAGHSREIIRLAASGGVTNAISSGILREAEEVLQYPKFSLRPEQVLSIIGLFRDTFELVVPYRRVNAVRADPDDNQILEAALAADADFVISGDRHLLDLSEWRDVSIVSPARFMTDIIGQQDARPCGNYVDIG